MARSVQITPGLAPGSSARLEADAAARSLSRSTLLRLAIEKTWPGTPGLRPPLPPVDHTERCPDGAWVQHVTSISAESFAQIVADQKRLRMRRRMPLLRAVIEQTYPPTFPDSES
jgi:hypothetical protein